MGLGSLLSPKPRPVLLSFFFLDLPPIFTLGGPGGDTEGHDWEAEELGGQLIDLFLYLENPCSWLLFWGSLKWCLLCLRQILLGQGTQHCPWNKGEDFCETLWLWVFH